MSMRTVHAKTPVVEHLERRDLLKTDVQLLPLHGPFCHCAGCACAAAAHRSATLINLKQNESTRSAFARAAPAKTASSSIKIDFQPNGAFTPSGYIADTGKVYGSRSNGRTFGWRNDNSKSHFDRNSSRSPDQRYDTTAQMSSTDVWEIKVPNGWYDVSVYLGDANKSGATLKLNVEGKLAAFIKLNYAEKRFGEGHIKVNVTDGKLTLATASGAKDNSIAFVDIDPISAPIQAPYKDLLKWSVSNSIKSPIGRVEAGTVRVGDKMFIMGGYSSADYKNVTRRVDIYNIKTNSWSRGTDLPGTQTHAGVNTDGKYIYWVGGQYGALFNRVGSNESWRYDIAANKWQRYENLPVVRFGGALAYDKGNLYFYGGAMADRNTASAKAWKLDTTDSTPDWKPIADMPRAGDHLGHAVVNGMIYAIGGEHDHGNSYIQHDDLFAYNPDTNKWTRRASMPTASSHFEGNVVEYQNKLYVFGGQIDAQQLSSQVRSYDPVTNKWTRHNSLPELRKGGVSWFNNGRFHYLTGDAQGKGHPTYALVGQLK